MSIRKHYDEALAELNQALIEMGQAVTDAVENAMEALATTDAEAAAQIIKDDNQVNEMEHDIEHRCMVLLLRQQPVAGDLRRVSATLKVITDLERIGDHAADIAEIMPHLFASRKAGDPAVSEAIKMGQKLQRHQAHPGRGDRGRPQPGGRRAGSADGHQVPGADRGPRRQPGRVGPVHPHRPVQERGHVLTAIFPGYPENLFWARR